MENRSDHITRREAAAAIASVLAGAVFGCRPAGREEAPSVQPAPEPAAPAKPAVTGFDALAALLERQFTVHEVCRCGPQTVVVVRDVHVETMRERLFSCLSHLERLIDLELIGVESYIEGPDAPADKRVAQRLAEVFRLDPAKILCLGGGAGAEELSLPGTGNLAPLFRDPRFKAIGIEREELYARTACAAIVEDCYSLLLEAAGARKYIAVSSADGRYEPHMLQMMQAEQELARHFPTYPRFDIRKLSRLATKSGDAVIAGPDDARYIGEMAWKFREWMNTEVVIARNGPAADRMHEVMQREGFTRAAVVLGRDHSNRGLGGKTIQEQLKDRNLSSIVLDP